MQRARVDRVHVLAMPIITTARTYTIPSRELSDRERLRRSNSQRLQGFYPSSPGHFMRRRVGEHFAESALSCDVCLANRNGSSLTAGVGGLQSATKQTIEISTVMGLEMQEQNKVWSHDDSRIVQ